MTQEADLLGGCGSETSNDVYLTPNRTYSARLGVLCQVLNTVPRAAILKQWWCSFNILTTVLKISCVVCCYLYSKAFFFRIHVALLFEFTSQGKKRILNVFLSCFEHLFHKKSEARIVRAGGREFE